MTTRISYAERARIFGAPGHVARRQVTTPWGIVVSCHELIVDRFVTACHHARYASSWTPRRIDSYNYRLVRGSTSASLHGWALAWDFFDRPYPEPVDVWGPKNAPDKAFRDAFATHGFALGADFHTRQDWPHIEWCDGLPAVDIRPTPTIKRRAPSMFLVQHPNGVVELCTLVAGSKIAHVGLEDPTDRDRFVAAGVPLIEVTDATWAKWTA